MLPAMCVQSLSNDSQKVTMYLFTFITLITHVYFTGRHINMFTVVYGETGDLI